jgi:hypothetical protein
MRELVLSGHWWIVVVLGYGVLVLLAFLISRMPGKKPQREYRVVTVHPSSDNHIRAKYFLEMAARDGWELVTVLEIAQQRGAILYAYYFKREK